MAVTWCCAKCAPGGGQGSCTQRVCGEETANIPFMLVTLDVLKLRGWLNACDSCARLKPRGEGAAGRLGKACAAGYKKARSACRAART